MLGGGGGEYRRRFSGQRARGPERAGGVEKVFQWRGHVAETRRAAEREPGAVAQVFCCGVGRATGGYRFGRGIERRRHRRHAAQARLHARHRFHAARNLLGHALHGAMAAVVENQDFGHELVENLQYIFWRTTERCLSSSDYNRAFDEPRMPDHGLQDDGVGELRVREAGLLVLRLGGVLRCLII